MSDAAPDPYTVRHGESHAPPRNLWGRVKYLGPSLIVTGAVVGAGEMVLTTSLGAVVGWSLLWWMLLSCWCKSLVQAEVARYTIMSGDTYLRALNRVPGKKWGLSWPIWVHIVAYIPTTIGFGGLVGGSGQAMVFLASAGGVELDDRWCTGVVAFGAALILSTGSYKLLERVMLVFVAVFTVATLICAIAMQFTEYQTDFTDVIAGMNPDFALLGTAAVAFLAFSAYGSTGTTAGDISSYTYWCIEKGYPSFVGSDRSNPDWEPHARGWMRVVHTDIMLALVILTCATIPYYALGAGVLHKMGLRPGSKADEVIPMLSNIFTQTLGPWAVWVFSIGAFFILFSTVLSVVGGGGRFIPDYFIEAKVFDRSNVAMRKKITRWYVIGLPLVAFVIYLFIPNFFVLVMISGLTSAVTMPMQAGVTLWLHSRKLDPRIRPHMPARIALWAIFIFQCVMVVFLLRFVAYQKLLDHLAAS
jgi:Mn2+/Fe2+ NRAMP family transporter